MDNQDDILRKINDGVYELSKKRKGKSGVWNIFAEIRKADGSILQGYLCCRKCVRLYKFDGKRTSNLNRHKCYSSVSKETYNRNNHLALLENSSNDYDFANDVKACDPIASTYIHNEPQHCETQSEMSCRSSINTNMKLSDNRTNAPGAAHRNAKQVESLCEMIKSDLQDVPEMLFFDAKWKIMDILREVHRSQLNNKLQSSASTWALGNGESGSGSLSSSMTDQGIVVSPSPTAPKKY
ncbi:uncharacterized protein LOC128862333 [Anastrepha ludens]|uniref:uncharacterized protein LOC128862333 n=1 Tax=Anastrepha ludens TaxID=28586 RepID=UPI0023AFF292|nr:uncharacterized protein LOC128862333 [Anastrepha ludens]